MAFSLVAHKSNGANGAVTTAAIDTTGASLIVINVGSSTSPGALSDSKSNTWTPLTQKTFGGIEGAQLWYAIIPL